VAADAIWDAYEKASNPNADPASPVRLLIINPVDLACDPVPAREWIVHDWLPVGCVTALYGDGGVGKTLLTQQLMTSTALGRPWCGFEVTRCPSLGLFCEDDEAELHRRQVAICAAYGAGLSGLGDMRWISGVGQDSALIDFAGDRGFTTGTYDAIKRAAQDHGATLIVLDTAADLFAGNENDRHQVRRFVGMLNGLAYELNAAVLLNAHPSRTGLKSGDLDGGSTAWSNSVRSRWSLARPDADSGADTGNDADARILTRRKANYSSVGDSVKLRWQNGVLVPDNCGTGKQTAAEADYVFLKLLDRFASEKRAVSASKNAGNYAPKQFACCPDRQGVSQRQLEIAMSNLFASRQITMEPYGPKGKGSMRIARTLPTPEC
jgi:RecA-family ATPase